MRAFSSGRLARSRLRAGFIGQSVSRRSRRSLPSGGVFVWSRKSTFSRWTEALPVLLIQVWLTSFVALQALAALFSLFFRIICIGGGQGLFLPLDGLVEVADCRVGGGERVKERRLLPVGSIADENGIFQGPL